MGGRCDVRTKYASHLHPSSGWVVWTFLSSLGEIGFFSILLIRSGSAARIPEADKADRGYSCLAILPAEDAVSREGPDR